MLKDFLRPKFLKLVHNRMWKKYTKLIWQNDNNSGMQNQIITQK